MYSEFEPARKVRIADLVNGEFVSGRLVTPAGLSILRARVLATVVRKFISEKYGFLVLDDGSATIRAKIWQDTKLFDGIKPGAIIDMIGSVRQHQDEIYLVPNLIRVLRDPNWITLREAELLAQDRELEDVIQLLQAGNEEVAIRMGIDQSVINKAREKKLLHELERKKILMLIAQLDKGNGVSYVDIIAKSGLPEEVVDKVISELLSSGECYEPRPGQIKRV
jgi:hypothetical protein